MNVLLLFFLLRCATGFLWRSFIVAALFALHPFNVECVAWVSERRSLLCTFFLFLALFAYVWYIRKPGVVNPGGPVRFRTRLETNDHHPAIRASAARLLASRTSSDSGRLRKHVPLFQEIVAARPGENSTFPFVSRQCVRHGACSGSVQRHRREGDFDFPGALGERTLVVSLVHPQRVVAHAPDHFLSTPGRYTSALETASGSRRHFGHHLFLHKPPPSPLLDCRLVLVSRLSRTSHRIGSSRPSGHGRLLRLHASFRDFRSCCMVDCGPLCLAAAPLGTSRRRVRDFSDFLWSFDLAANHVLERQFHCLWPRPENRAGQFHCRKQLR